ncbi:MAG: gamma-glutamyltransferase [Ardenticatenaceae bacterium]|nr:gamma-glutamyltransferase [Ardenticatenaceae bacterium]
MPGTGVALQNRSALFRLDPEHPNALAPGKRLYHTIIPAMTTHNGELHSSFGVMGGYMQPQGHLQLLVNLLDLQMSPQEALDAPRWMLAGPDAPLGAEDAGGLVHMEEGWDPAIVAALAERGHRIVPVVGGDRDIFGGGQLILRDPETGVVCGGSDPRKDGFAVGW